MKCGQQSLEGACVYLHRMPCKLVHDDGVFGLIERARDVLHKQTQRLLIVLRRHCGSNWQASFSRSRTGCVPVFGFTFREEGFSNAVTCLSIYSMDKCSDHRNK